MFSLLCIIKCLYILDFFFMLLLSVFRLFALYYKEVKGQGIQADILAPTGLLLVDFDFLIFNFKAVIKTLSQVAILYPFCIAVPSAVDDSLRCQW